MTVFINTSRFDPGPQHSNTATFELMLNRLTPADQLSMCLFSDNRFERSRRGMKAMDEINARHGRDTVRFGAARPGGRWETKFLRRPRCYTTRLSEVLQVD